MSGIVALLRFVAVFLAALLAGGQFFVLQAVIPVKRRISTRDSVLLHQEMLHDQADSYLLPAGVISGAAAAATLLLSPGFSKPANRWTLLGLLGTVGVAITSERFNKPTNREILTWSLDAIPEDYPAIRSRWDTVHTIRTASGILTLVAFVLSAFTSFRHR